MISSPTLSRKLLESALEQDTLRGSTFGDSLLRPWHGRGGSGTEVDERNLWGTRGENPPPAAVRRAQGTISSRS